MMPRASQFTGLFGVSLLLLAVASAADPANPPKKKQPPDPPRTAPYMGELRLLWDKIDADKDGYLDKKELAVAYRGPRAKPYDWRETARKEKDDPKLKTDGKKPESKKDDKSDSLKDKPSTPKTGKKPDYSKYPDYTFLVAVDTDADGKVSRDEYMVWARQYAIQVRDAVELNKKATALQAKLKKTPAKAKNRRTMEAQLRKQKADIARLQRQINKYKIPK